MENNMKMLDRKWQTIEDVSIENISALVAETVSVYGSEIHIGTDSQQHGKHTQFVSIITILRPGKGGRAFYTKERTPRIKVLRERLLKEVWMSVAIAMELSPIIGEDKGLTVHVDANPNIKFQSSQYIKELTSLVVGQGFDILLKPESWAATHVADHTVKHRVLGG